MTPRLLSVAALGLSVVAACTPSAPDTGAPAPRSLPQCAAVPESFPCQLPYDVAPVLEQRPPHPDTSGERRSPHVWMFVDDSGVVRATEIQRSAGLDYDFPAVAIARKLRFRPATLTGRPVPAWVLLPITTAAQPEPCPDMAVPLSAGVATFVDSTVLERPELGTLYRFEGVPELLQGVGELRPDVFIYPSTGWGPAEDQAKTFLDAMEIERQRGRFVSFELIEEKPRSVEVRGRGRRVTFRGHTVRVLLVGPAGQTRESYFVVFPHADWWVKIRVTYPPSAEARKLIDEFQRQLLSALADNPPQCPL